MQSSYSNSETKIYKSDINDIVSATVSFKVCLKDLYYVKEEKI